MAKFLIIQTAFIGDVVLATALIESLHSAFPGAAIDFLLRKGNEDLLTSHPFLRRVLIWDKKKHKTRNLLRLVRTVRRERYDRVINAQRFFATGLLTALSGAGETSGFDKNPWSRLFTRRVPHAVAGTENLHETARNQRLIESFAGSETLRPKLYPSPADFAAVAGFTGSPFITISPASVWFTKQFPAGQWIALLGEVPEQYRVLLLGGPGDRVLCEEIAAGAGGRPLVLAGSLSFLQSAALMDSARMNYVNDSAPMHFASAMNAPVTAVYCSTVPEFGFGPLSTERFIVQIPEALYCRPCGLHGYAACPEGHFRCARAIPTPLLVATLPLAAP